MRKYAKCTNSTKYPSTTKAVTSLELMKLFPAKSVHSVYRCTEKDKNILWRDIHCLFYAGEYSAARDCTVLLMEIAEKEGNIGLYKRSLLVLARLFVLLNDSRASNTYRALIAQEYSEIFVYTTPYSYSIDLFKRAEIIDSSSSYLFIFSEYLINVKRSKIKEKQEYLFYRLIILHILHKDPWDASEHGIDLSLLPPHIRAPYVRYTTEVLNRKEYDQQVTLSQTKTKDTTVNRRNTKHLNNFHSIFQ